MIDFTTAIRGWIGLLALGLSVAQPVLAQATWPSKPVKLVVGFSAGGPTDIVARAFAEQATHDLGQPVIVDNKPGANSIIAAEAVANATDQHTFLVAATNHSMIPALYQSRVKFDAVNSYKPICTFVVSPTVLVIGASIPTKTLAQFIQKAKAAPESITYGSSGIGSSSHFAGEAFGQIAGVKMTHVPYKGSSQIVADLLGGQLDASFATLGSVLSHAKSGKLTILAIASPKRHPQLPAVPTFEELGVPGYSADAWYGLMAPSGITATALQAMEKSIQSYLASPVAVEKFKALGLDPQATCGQAFQKLLTNDVKSYVRLAQSLGLKAE